MPRAAEKIAVFTSIMPGNIDRQLAVMATWRAIADTVVTVNVDREAQTLPKLPDWVTCWSFRDDAIPYGRDFVRLSKLAEAIGQVAAGHDLAIFCNSDIALADPGFLDAGCGDGAGLLYMSRVDIDESGKQLGVFDDGFDLFALPPRHARVLADDGLFIGLPWWDFYVPLKFLKAGLGARRLKAGAIHHLKHVQKWDMTRFFDRGNYVYECLTDQRPDTPLTDHEVDVLSRDIKRFLNSGLLAEPAGNGQQETLEQLVALWLGEYEAVPGGARVPLPVELWRRLRVWAAVRTSAALRSHPEAYHAARTLYRGLARASRRDRLVADIISRAARDA